jgi:hypothetical protein
MKEIISKAFNYSFVLRPHPVLKLLYRLKLDLILFTLPVFIYNNRRSFLKLARLKLKGKSPKIVYFCNESDHRFDRFHGLSRSDDSLVVFKFLIYLANVEVYYFVSYAAKPIGFYEDARYRYIEPSNFQNRLNYRKYVHKLFDLLEFFTGKINLFLSGSNNDRYVVEMIHVAQERGTSWVVQEREGTGTDLTYKMESIGFKESGSVVAHYHFLANDKHSECFENAKTDSVRFTKTLGELDTDQWFYQDLEVIKQKYSAWDRYRKVLLFLTFGERNYIEPTSFPNNPELSWKPLIKDCEDVIFDFAKSNPDVLVLYRMGHKEDLNERFLNRVKDAALTNVISSTRETPFIEIAHRSDMIVGFQTTALFEAMFLDKPIIQVNWHIPSILNPETDLLPINVYNACVTANSKSEFHSLLEDWIAGRPVMSITDEIMQNRKKTREIMFHNADGRVSERFLLEIKKLLGVA